MIPYRARYLRQVHSSPSNSAPPHIPCRQPLLNTMSQLTKVPTTRESQQGRTNTAACTRNRHTQPPPPGAPPSQSTASNNQRFHTERSLPEEECPSSALFLPFLFSLTQTTAAKAPPSAYHTTIHNHHHNQDHHTPSLSRILLAYLTQHLPPPLPPPVTPRVRRAPNTSLSNSPPL
jgi:hypothetical protein